MSLEDSAPLDLSALAGDDVDAMTQPIFDALMHTIRLLQAERTKRAPNKPAGPFLMACAQAGRIVCAGHVEFMQLTGSIPEQVMEIIEGSMRECDQAGREIARSWLPDDLQRALERAERLNKGKR